MQGSKRQLDGEGALKPDAITSPLQGLRVLVVQGGSIGEKRGKLLASIAANLGAEAGISMAELGASDNQLIVVASPDLTTEGLIKRLAVVGDVATLTIVGDPWISCCAEINALVSWEQHRCFHAPAGVSAAPAGTSAGGIDASTGAPAGGSAGAMGTLQPTYQQEAARASAGGSTSGMRGALQPPQLLARVRLGDVVGYYKTSFASGSNRYLLFCSH